VDYPPAFAYLHSQLFSFMLPLLLLGAAIGAGARATAGEEERGTLDLLLANPVSRRRLVLDKVAALVVEVLTLGFVSWLSLVIGCRIVSLHVSAGHLAAATTAAVLLAVSFGAVALFVGAATGRRGAAVGVAAAGAVGAYLLSSLAELVDFLEPLRHGSPFYHYVTQDALRDGLAIDHSFFLIALAVVATAAAVQAFARRDLRTP
jgi:ABC-2 type transport system permease protein